MYGLRRRTDVDSLFPAPTLEVLSGLLKGIGVFCSLKVAPAHI